jgi:chitinase
MKVSRLILLGAIVLVRATSFATSLWSTAYYPGWTQDTMSATNIDFAGLTHVVHFSLVPRKDGSLDTVRNVITPAHSANIITNARAAGVKVLICVGGAGSQAGFQAAAKPARRAAFIRNLVSFASSHGYDGIDVDWEPLTPADAGIFANFIRDLRSAMNATGRLKLLTAATATQPAFFTGVQDQLDQINLMTYDLAGPWNGWMTWFNSALSDGGTQFPKGGKLVPSVDGFVKLFVTNGVARAKLGIGMPFYGYVWWGGAGTSTGGPTLPRQMWTRPPTNATFAFNHIMTNWFHSSRYHWDTNAVVPYLSIDTTDNKTDTFVSYDNEDSLRAKVRYAATNGLGGVMIWELSQGWRGDQPVGKRDPLLQAVKSARIEFSKTEIMAPETARP